MPFEPIYGFPIEAPSDLPGWSLTGGPDGSQPILAELVAAQLRRIDDLTQALADSFGTYPTLIQAGRITGFPLTTPVSSPLYSASYWRGSSAVVFDTVFSTAPSVLLAADSTVPGTVIECTASPVTTTGFTANVARYDQVNTGVFWIASARTQA